MGPLFPLCSPSSRGECGLYLPFAPGYSLEFLRKHLLRREACEFEDWRVQDVGEQERGGHEVGLEVGVGWVLGRAWASLLAGCSSARYFESQFPHLYNGANDSNSHRGWPKIRANMCILPHPHLPCEVEEEVEGVREAPGQLGRGGGGWLLEVPRASKEVGAATCPWDPLMNSSKSAPAPSLSQEVHAERR